MSTLRSGTRKRLRKVLSSRDGFRCFYCKTDFNYEIKSLTPTIDHKLPESRGGTHDSFNLALCCHSCNSLKGTLSLEEFLLSEYLLKRRIEVFRALLTAA